MRPTIFLMKSNGRTPQNPNKVPFKMQLPMTLRNHITGKSAKNKERGCLYEISLVLNCLQQNNFEDKLCTKEVEQFHNCYSSFLSKKASTKQQAMEGILTPNTKNLKYNQVNQLLKMYPQS